MKKLISSPKDIKIMENRSNVGSGAKGVDVGIFALEIFGINSGNDFFSRHK